MGSILKIGIENNFNMYIFLFNKERCRHKFQILNHKTPIKNLHIIVVISQNVENFVIKLSIFKELN